jgi:hypothetical protein
MDQNKVDLVMWTYNSEKNLLAVLQRIEEVIPRQVINRKIITDDNSKTRHVKSPKNSAGKFTPTSARA